MTNYQVEKIPIHLSTYEDLFNEFDGNSLEHRFLREDINDFIYESFKSVNKEKIVYLEIKIIKDHYDMEKEEAVVKAIDNYYAEKLTFQRRIQLAGLRRIIYYGAVSLILFVLSYYLERMDGFTLIALALNSGATVLLWQIMTLLFIERKNFKIKCKILEGLHKLNIKFGYYGCE